MGSTPACSRLTMVAVASVLVGLNGLIGHAGLGLGRPAHDPGREPVVGHLVRSRSCCRRASAPPASSSRPEPAATCCAARRSSTAPAPRGTWRCSSCGPRSGSAMTSAAALHRRRSAKAADGHARPRPRAPARLRRKATGARLTGPGRALPHATSWRARCPCLLARQVVVGSPRPSVRSQSRRKCTPPSTSRTSIRSASGSAPVLAKATLAGPTSRLGCPDVLVASLT